MAERINLSPVAGDFSGLVGETRDTSWEDFSLMMQDTYKFKKEEADLVWNILNEADFKKLDDRRCIDALRILR